MKEHDPGSGYFYVQLKPEDSESVIKRLDGNFEIISSTTLKYSKYHEFDFGAYSTSNGNFSVCCYKKRYLQCLLYNTLLKNETYVLLNHEKHNKYFKGIMHISAKNMLDGSVIVMFTRNVNYRAGTPVYLQRIDTRGQVSKPRIFGKIYCEIYGMHNFEMKDGEYCVSVTCNEMVYTRCIAIEKKLS